MNLFAIIGIAIGLAMDAFAVAVAASTSLGRITGRQVFRFAFHFGLFQAMMPVLGWLAGSRISGLIVHWDHWVAFALLAFIGGKAIYTVLVAKEEQKPVADPTRGVSLVLFSVATSIDAFAVGLSFAMLDVRIWLPSAAIGVITAILTALGMLLGGRLGERFGKRMELAGGLVLIAIGIKIVLDHTLGAPAG